MNKVNLLAGSLLSFALVTPAFAQTATPSTSQAYGTSAPATYTATSTSSSASSYGSTQGFFAPISDRIVSDPLYLPLAGQIEGITAYTANFESYSSKNYLGVKVANSNSLANSFNQTVNYGVTDEFEIGLGESYSFSHAYTDNQITGKDTSTATNGFDDPTFNATYRFIDQRHNYPVSANAGLTYTPNMIDAQHAGIGASGNEGSGRQSGTFTLSVGREMKNLTVEALTGVGYEGKERFEVLPSDVNYQSDPFWTYNAGINTQFRFTERLSLNADYRFVAQESTHITNDVTEVDNSASNPDDSEFTLALNYHFIPNRLVGQLSYEYVDYTNYGSAYARVKSDAEYVDQNQNIIGARLFYVFN